MFLIRQIQAVLAISALAVLCYGNTFHVPFILDDVTSIIGNPLVKSFTFTPKARILGDLSFALNYSIHGFTLPGYHLVNLLLHIGNALLVYALALSLFRTPQLEKCVTDSSSGLIALFAALVFAVHPLQTQAVTYLAQRVTLLAALCYLSSILLYVRARLQASRPGKAMLLLLSIIFASAGVLSKENAVTLPLMALFCELTFFRGDKLKRCLPFLGFLLPMAALLGVVYAKGWGGQELVSSFQSISAETGAPSRVQYLLTQFPVLLVYLRLFFLPAGQNLDHDQPLRTSFTDPAVAASFFLLAALAISGAYLLYKGRKRSDSAGWLYTLGGFGIIWFFTTISIESGLIPIRDVIFEHRMYLPSAGIVIAVSALVRHLFLKTGHSERIFLAAASLAVLALAVGTFSRNRVWQSEIGIWEDVVKKSPAKGRGYGALGHAYQRAGKLDEAERSYLKVVQLSPSDHIARNNLGALYLKQKRYQEALEQLSAAKNAVPANAKVHFNLGIAFSGMGRYKEAEASFAEALRLRPDYREAAENLDVLRKFTAR